MKKAIGVSAALDVARKIAVVRGHRVLLDRDLAELYGVETRRLNEQVRRNLSRFPEDFMFSLTRHEIAKRRRIGFVQG